MQFTREDNQLFVSLRTARAVVTQEQALEVARFVLRQALGSAAWGEREARLQAGPLWLVRGSGGVRVHLDGHAEEVTLPASVGVVGPWLRSLNVPVLEWDVHGANVVLLGGGVPLWAAGPQTAATFGVALALDVAHAGVFFGAEIPFAGAAPTAVIPDARGDGRLVRVGVFEQKRFGLRLNEVGGFALSLEEYGRLQRQLVGVLRALTLERPNVVPALRTLEALVLSG